MSSGLPERRTSQPRHTPRLCVVVLVVAALLSVAPASVAATKEITFSGEPVAVAPADGTTLTVRVTVSCPANHSVLEAFIYVVQSGQQNNFVGIPLAERTGVHVDSARSRGSGMDRWRGLIVGLCAAGTEVHDVVRVSGGTVAGRHSLTPVEAICLDNRQLLNDWSSDVRASRCPKAARIDIRPGAKLERHNGHRCKDARRHRAGVETPELAFLYRSARPACAPAWPPPASSADA
jgi:hypothetical protein